MIGIDIGGSNARVALVREDRLLAQDHLTTTAERTPVEICDEISAIARRLVADGSDLFESTRTGPAAIGVGVAGQIDVATGVVRDAPNLGWHDFPLRDCLATALALPVTVLNDVQSAAYGEAVYGAARGVSDAVALFVGTGVGGGLIAGGELVRGCTGSAGELGHTIVELNGLPCRCGRHGCIEAYAGGWAIAKRARDQATSRPAEGRRLLELAASLDTLTSEVVARAAREGDPLAAEIVHAAGVALGAGIASIANAFNPCAIVLGGGVIEGVPELAAIAEEVARARALPAATRSLRIVRAALGAHAGTIGAAAWALRAPGRKA